MRRILVGLLAVGLVLGFGLSGLAVVKVGTLFSYTGPLAEFGAPEHDGAVLAAAELNAAAVAVLGEPIMELVREDAATDPKVGTERAQKLVQIDNVVGIVGAMASGVTIPVAINVSIPSEVPQISNASTSPLISVLPEDEGQDFLFRTTASDALQGVVLGKLAILQGLTTASALYVNNPYGQGLAEAFKAEFERLGGKVMALIPHPEEALPSYVSELEAALAGDPEVLAAISYPGHATIYLKESMELFDFTNWLFCDGTKSEEIGRALGAEVLEGLLGTAPAADPRRATYKAFEAAYEAEYGRVPPLPFIDAAYDATVALGLAIAKCVVDGVEATGLNVRDRLRDVANPPGEVITVGKYEYAMQLLKDGKDINYEGAAGSVDFDAAGDVITPIGVWKYNEGAPSDLFVVTKF
jgi:ABC-type branched-subunit amino acid transport system substrate-binding protein